MRCPYIIIFYFFRKASEYFWLFLYREIFKIFSSECKSDEYPPPNWSLVELLFRCWIKRFLSSSYSWLLKCFGNYTFYYVVCLLLSMTCWLTCHLAMSSKLLGGHCVGEGYAWQHWLILACLGLILPMAPVGVCLWDTCLGIVGWHFSNSSRTCPANGFCRCLLPMGKEGRIFFRISRHSAYYRLAMVACFVGYYRVSVYTSFQFFLSAFEVVNS